MCHTMLHCGWLAQPHMAKGPNGQKADPAVQQKTSHKIDCYLLSATIEDQSLFITCYSSSDEQVSSCKCVMSSPGL